MAKRILVPIDEGLAAETLLSVAAGVARDGGATVRMLHVAPVPGNVVGADGRVVAYTDQEMERITEDWTERMRGLQPHLHQVPVEYVVRFGDAADEILTEADAFGADLIAVTTTCRSGLKRALLGSVAEALVRKARTTVMLVRPAI
jgi:nucleotide-binding universal stress UspA family protein